ncbi:MAG: monovalent cation/H(+) antiporter subunit G [Pseudomonadota bacterium]
MDYALDIASWLLIGFGGFFCVVSGIGLVRMPDLYTRLHAASLVDSLGSLLILAGLLLQATDWIVAVKLVLLYALIFFTTPVASHALAQAAIVAGLKPKLTHDRRAKPDFEPLDPAAVTSSRPADPGQPATGRPVGSPQTP